MEAVRSGVAPDMTVRVRGAGAIEAAPPVFFVDDVRITGDAQTFMSTLEPNDILRIEVIKGAAAIRQHPDATNGIIQVYIKPGRGGAVKPGV
jgi:outer membrane receptor protein involved in Fe transport